MATKINTDKAALQALDEFVKIILPFIDPTQYEELNKHVAVWAAKWREVTDLERLLIDDGSTRTGTEGTDQG